MSEPMTTEGRALLDDLSVSAWFVQNGYGEAIENVEAAAYRRALDDVLAVVRRHGTSDAVILAAIKGLAEALG